jgi:hypothetical protein
MVFFHRFGEFFTKLTKTRRVKKISEGSLKTNFLRKSIPVGAASGDLNIRVFAMYTTKTGDQVRLVARPRL